MGVTCPESGHLIVFCAYKNLLPAVMAKSSLPIVSASPAFVRGREDETVLSLVSPASLESSPASDINSACAGAVHTQAKRMLLCACI